MGRMILSICAVVVALGLVGAQSSEHERQGARRQPSTAEGQDGSNGQPSAPSSTSEKSLQRIAGAMEAEVARGASEQEDDQASRDLQAQESMAWWAQLMFWAAAAGTLLSGLGVFLIWRTLLYTRTAAGHSEKMVIEAAKATEAALRSAKVAEQALVGVERPFLVFQPGKRLGNAQYYSFVNHGRTPCVILQSDVRFLPITLLDAPEPLTANVWQAALTPDWNIVGANGEATGEEFVRLGKPIVPNAEAAGMMMLHGYAMYRSLTGDTFVSGFGLYRRTNESWKALTEAAFNYDERLKKGGPRKRERMKVTITAREPNDQRGD
tara:strand:- start:99 stop:1067 length:969 start_codon:yes stop_codon:yes gene_type:complete